MSQPRLARTELLLAAETELDAAGYTYREEIGGKHPRLVVDVNGREETIVLSSTPSDWRAVKNKRAFVRRKIREWQGEMEPQQIELIEPHSALIYNGVTIRDDKEMLSLTDMWKASGSPSGRAPSDWNSLVTTKEFVSTVENSLNAEIPGIITKKGKGGGTWAYWQIGLAYAKYLSHDFHMWCNRVVRSHMTGEPMEDESSARPPAVYSDDIATLLEMLSDIQSAVISAIQRSDSHAIDRVEDTKAALLHYMKVQLKEPSYAFFDDVRARNKAAFDRDALIIREMRSLTTAINGLVQKAEQPLLSRQFVFADWYDHDKIYQEYFPDQIIPNRRFLSQAISKSLDAYCKKRQRGFDMQSRRIGGRNVNLWHKDSVKSWIEVSGREIVRHHLAKIRRADPVVVAFGGKQ